MVSEFFIDIILPAALWPGIDSTSLTFPVRNGGRCVGLPTLPPSRAYCLDIWEPQPPGTLMACTGIALPILHVFPNDILHLIRLSWSNTESCEKLSRIFCSPPPEMCVTVNTDSGIYFVIRCVVVERGRASTTAPAQFEYGARDSTQPSARQPTGSHRAPSTTRSH